LISIGSYDQHEEFEAQEVADRYSLTHLCEFLRRTTISRHVEKILKKYHAHTEFFISLSQLLALFSVLSALRLCVALDRRRGATQGCNSF
jgi:hypothetical protein